jgi:hypothetical protein
MAYTLWWMYYCSHIAPFTINTHRSASQTEAKLTICGLVLLYNCDINILTQVKNYMNEMQQIQFFFV